MTPSYQLHELGSLGAELGNGKTGIVYTLPQHPTLVFKRYTNPKDADQVALSALIDWPARLVPAEQSLLRDTTAWPRALVWEGNALVGIVMARAPSRFTHRRLHGERALTTLSFAISPNRPHVRRRVPHPSQKQRLLLAYSLCRLLALFEREEIVFTDLSSKNILWSLRPKPTVFLLDCDSAFFLRLPRPEASRTANWLDPWFLTDYPSPEEVRGLFPLVFARLVFAREYANTKSRLVLPLDSPYARTFQRLVNDGYSPDRTHRPHLTEWQSRIEKTLNTPVWNVSVSFPKPDRLYHAAKQLYEELKKNITVLINTNMLISKAATFIAEYKSGLVIATVIFLYIVIAIAIFLKTMRSTFEEQQPIQQVRQVQPVNLPELITHVIHESQPIFCMLYRGRTKITIYALGIMELRSIRIDMSEQSGHSSSHMIIKSGIVYRWNNTNHRGEKYTVVTQAVKKFLDQFQSNTVMRCEKGSSLLNHEFEYKFEVPTNIEFIS